MIESSTIALVAWALLVLGGFRRSAFYGVFATIVLSFPILVGNALRDTLGAFGPAVLYLQLIACVHFGLIMIQPTLRPRWFRALVSVPALWFVAATMLAFPWAIAAGLGFEPVGAWIPFVLCLFGVVQSLYTRRERVDIVLDGRDIEVLARHPAGVFRDRAPSREGRPLRIVQITDPHLGPFMSVERLRGICERAVADDPDLVLVTGDLMTMESHDEAVVTAALAPLAQLRGRVFVWRDRNDHLGRLAERFPRSGDALRLWLLHDPGAFKHIPVGEADLVLSGHTHGGQVGLVSLGLPWTFLSAVSSIPDHGLWARGPDRLYVHRANGHYGYPIRLGVPAEESVLHIWRA